MNEKMKLQSAIDFLSAYGLSILIVIVAIIAIILILGAPSNSNCTSPPGFSCDFVSISANGIATMKLSQATGSQIKINGVACSDQQNATNDTPKYGNVKVTKANSQNLFYPTWLGINGDYPPGNTINSGSSYVLYVNCYQTGGTRATGTSGQQFSGYIWINYTIPNYGTRIQKVATFTASYSST